MAEWQTATSWYACDHDKRRIAYKPIPGSAHYHVSLQVQREDGWEEIWVAEATGKPQVGEDDG